MAQPKCEWESDSQIAGGIIFWFRPTFKITGEVLIEFCGLAS
jgi:hypothetical protein